MSPISKNEIKSFQNPDFPGKKVCPRKSVETTHKTMLNNKVWIRRGQMRIRLNFTPLCTSYSISDAFSIPIFTWKCIHLQMMVVKGPCVIVTVCKRFGWVNPHHDQVEIFINQDPRFPGYSVLKKGRLSKGQKDFLNSNNKRMHKSHWKTSVKWRPRRLTMNGESLLYKWEVICCVFPRK